MMRVMIAVMILVPCWAFAEDSVEEMRAKIAAHDQLGQASERLIQAKAVFDQEVQAYKEMRANFAGDVSKDIALTVRSADKIASLSRDGALADNATQKHREIEFDARLNQKSAQDALAAAASKKDAARVTKTICKAKLNEAISTAERVEQSRPQIGGGNVSGGSGTTVVYNDRESQAEYSQRVERAQEQIVKARRQFEESELAFSQASDEFDAIASAKADADRNITAIAPAKVAIEKITVYKLLDGRTINTVSHVDAGDDVLLKTKDGKIERIKKDQVLDISR